MKEPLYDAIPFEDRSRIMNQAQAINSVISDVIPPANRKGMAIFNVFHLRLMDKRILVTQKFVPLAVDVNGNVEVGAFFFMPSNKDYKGLTTIVQGNRLWTFNCRTFSLIEYVIPLLSTSEKIMMSLSRSGLSVKEIADILYLSEGSVKKQRDRLFKKLGVASLSEALALMDNLGLWSV